MKKITDEQIRKIKLTTDEVFSWVNEVHIHKNESILPAKVSMKPEDGKFFNVMPAILKNNNVVGTKIVSRIPGQDPLIKGDIFLHNLDNGNLEYIVDGTYITSLRTGVAAAYGILQIIKEADSYEIGLVGLGNVTTIACDFLFDKLKDKKLHVKLYEFQEEHIRFKDRYKNYTNIEFEYVDTYEKMIRDSDIIISGVPYASDNFGEVEWFKKGVTIVPIHTRGFQNLDKLADKIIIDDTEHIRGFKYFNEFRNCSELQEVLKGNKKARDNDEQIIILYMVGIVLLDIVFAQKLLEKIEK